MDMLDAAIHNWEVADAQDRIQSLLKRWPAAGDRLG